MSRQRLSQLQRTTVAFPSPRGRAATGGFYCTAAHSREVPSTIVLRTPSTSRRVADPPWFRAQFQDGAQLPCGAPCGGRYKGRPFTSHAASTRPPCPNHDKRRIRGLIAAGGATVSSFTLLRRLLDDRQVDHRCRRGVESVGQERCAHQPPRGSENPRGAFAQARATAEAWINRDVSRAAWRSPLRRGDTEGSHNGVVEGRAIGSAEPLNANLRRGRVRRGAPADKVRVILRCGCAIDDGERELAHRTASRSRLGALRQLVRRRADGRCECCRLAQNMEPLSFHIEHIVSRQHGKSGDDGTSGTNPKRNVLNVPSSPPSRFTIALSRW